jgi:hypothetical protein
MINDRCEVFARYSYTALDSDTPGFSLSEDNFHELTAGANYYMHGHAAKFTIDASILCNGSPADISAADYTANDGDTEVVVRAQFQLLL